MIKNLVGLGKSSVGYARLKYKSGELTLETVIKMLLLALLFGVLSFFIYKFLVKKIGEDTITPIITDTNKKATENGGILNSIFGSGETPQE